jgi:hypothetical protein
LDDYEVEEVFNDNPQNHGERGFDKGWPSRFDTWFKIAKEFGFIWYEMNQEIKFSESGLMLLDKDNPQYENIVFANVFAKYQRNNPFRRVNNKNKPLILLLKVINLLNNDTDFNSTGISKKEIPIILCWPNDNEKELYQTIKELRRVHGFNPSDEVVLSICESYLDKIKRNHNSILDDYPDDFIRKIRLTGLISIRGGGRFIDINKKELGAVEYVLSNYSDLKEYNIEKDFYEYMSCIDQVFIKNLSLYLKLNKTDKRELSKWVDYFSWNTLKLEMLNLANKKISKDEILKIIEQPLRLEFLTTLSILKKIPNAFVSPNFISDDEGLPVSFAAGGGADIECEENDQKVLIEVTLLTGTQQHIRESYSIQRHLEDVMKKNKKAYTIFISPKSFIDTVRHAVFIKTDGFDVRVLDIKQLVNNLESYNTLNDISINISN